MKTWITYALVSGLSLPALFACDSEKGEGEEAEAPSGPAVGVLELPVSLRASSTAPTDFRKIEASPTEIRLDDKVLMALEGGKVPAAEQQGGVIGKLKAGLSSPASSRVALHLHSSLPYESMAMILNTASAAGVKNASFQVRAPGGDGTKTGWLEVNNFQMTPRTDDEVKFAGVEPRKWDEFATAWQQVYDACRTAQTGSCAYTQTNVAKGGNLKIVLFASGSGVNLNFYRVGLSPEELAAEEKQRENELGSKKQAFLDGRMQQKDLEEELLEGPPATQAMFQFRAREATNQPSPVSTTLAPVCGPNACGAVISADEPTLTVRVISLIGAAFPEGTAPPTLAFEQPWTPHPKAPPPPAPSEPEETGGGEGDEANE